MNFSDLKANQLLRFLLVGGVNTAFGYIIYAALVYASLLPELALLIATIAGIIFNFFTTGRLVFGSRNNGLFARFALAYIAIYLIAAGCLRVLIGININPLIAQAIIMPFSVIGTFVVMRLFVFRGTTP